MNREFYQGGGVSHPVPEAHFARTFELALAGSPYLDAWILESGGQTAGYMQVSLTYANDAGGVIVLLEELYVRPAFQGHGLGTEALDLVESEFRGRAVLISLEVMPENSGAIRLYEKRGYRSIVYQQMALPLT